MNGFTGCIRPSSDASARQGLVIGLFIGQLPDKQIEVVNERAASG